MGSFQFPCLGAYGKGIKGLRSRIEFFKQPIDSYEGITGTCVGRWKDCRRNTPDFKGKGGPLPFSFEAAGMVPLAKLTARARAASGTDARAHREAIRGRKTSRRARSNKTTTIFWKIKAQSKVTGASRRELLQAYPATLTRC